MTVTKRLRYEILKRDNHSCRYCGAVAPDAPLTVDHVVPVALGGSDEPTNLVTACRDCNSGKSSASASDRTVEDVSALAVMWSSAMDQAATERAIAFRNRADIEAQFLSYWNRWSWTDRNGSQRTVDLPNDWPASIHQFLRAGLALDDLDELVDVAMRAQGKSDEWKYFCGCCWTRVKQAQSRAQEILREQGW